MAAKKKSKHSKQDLVDELVSTFAADLEAMLRAQQATVEGATHPEARPENDKDTRALEQTYLARGQAMRVEEMQREMAEMRQMIPRQYGPDMAISFGALVWLESDDDERTVFVAPASGGTMLAGKTIQVVTPKSPLGVALIGKLEGEEVELRIGSQKRTYAIIKVE